MKKVIIYVAVAAVNFFATGIAHAGVAYAYLCGDATKTAACICFYDDCKIPINIPTPPDVVVLLEEGHFQIFVTKGKDVFYQSVITGKTYIKKLFNAKEALKQFGPDNGFVVSLDKNNQSQFIVEFQKTLTNDSILGATGDPFRSYAVLESNKVKYNTKQLDALMVISNFGFEISPNPFKIFTVLTIKEALLSLGNASFRARDAQGEVLISIDNITSSNTVIQRNNLPPGVLFVDVVVGTMIIGSQKLIVVEE